MARFAIIDSGVVANIVEADTDFAALNGWIPASNAAIGDLFDGATFTPSPVPAPQAPQAVSMRQARLALLEAGLLDQVTAAIQSGGQAEQIEWEYATEVRRDSALVSAMAVALNMSDAQLDGLFIAAAEK